MKDSKNTTYKFNECEFKVLKRSLASDYEIIECIGYYGFPIAPNGPCSKCKYNVLCQHIRQNFVPKTKLKPILERLEGLERRITVAGVGRNG